MTTRNGRISFPFLSEDSDGLLTFCFHHAGGSAATYRSWVGVNTKINAVPVELPGKATRSDELWIESFDQLTDRLAEEVANFLKDKPFALYGHSMGAAVAYQTAVNLEKNFQLVPEALVIAARQAPGEVVEGEYHSSMGLPALRKELETIGGTPPEILANDDIMELILAGIHRDYLLHEDFHLTDAVLDCPILAFAGDHDPSATPDMLAQWSSFTSGKFLLSIQPGGHFFPLDSGKEFLETLAAKLAELRRNSI